MRPALVLVDWQQDFLTGRRLVPGAEGVVARARRLLAGCRERGVPIFHGRLTVDRERDTRMPHWKAAGRWECVRGTEGHAAPDGLGAEAGEVVVEKQFFRVFASGELASALAAAEVDTILLSGVYLNACIRAAALDAYELGYRVLIAEDAVASDRPLAAAEARDYLSARGIRFVSVKEVLLGLEGGEIAFGDGCGAAVEAAVRGAGKAWEGWRELAVRERMEGLRRFAAILESEGEGLAELITETVGKPIAMARAEVARCGAVLEAICGGMDGAELELETGLLGDGTRVRRVPVGVVAMLTPFNHPAAIPVGKFVPAIVYGNAVVWKPAPAGVAVAERLVEWVGRALGREGLLTVVAGGVSTGVALMRHAGVSAVTLTGGTQAGYAAQYVCGERRIPLQAELGGNNGAIVWSDADLEYAAVEIARGAFGFGGQRCTANRRVIVESGCAEAFLERLVEATRGLVCGKPLDEATVVGPLVSEEARERVKGVVERARASGLQVLQPHEGRDKGWLEEGMMRAWYPPTIVVCDGGDHEVVREETFGPVLVVQRAADWAEALDLCNGVEEGLVAALFTESERRQEEFLRRAEAGVLKLNQATADVGVEAPFGGWKRSGVGPPEHGAGNREFYTRWQAIYGLGD